MNEKHKTILSILNDAKYPLMTSEIFEAMEPTEQGMFSGVDKLSKMLTDIKRKNHTIENGITEYIDGKSRLRWTLSDKGKKELFNALNPGCEVPDKDVEDASAIALHKLIYDDSPDIYKDTLIHNDNATGYNEMNTDDKFELIQEDNPLAFFDVAVSNIRDMLETLIKNEKTFKINNKKEKIDALEHLITFIEPINSEWAQIIDDIITDIKSLDSYDEKQL